MLLDRVIFICQSYDTGDTNNASTVSWVKSFRQNTLSLSVLALRANVTKSDQDVMIFGNGGKLKKLVRFYFLFMTALKSSKCKTSNIVVFIYQGGPYVTLLYPLKVLFRFRVVQWKAHPVLDLTAFTSCFFADRIITSTKSAFPITNSKVRAIGQAVDTATFYNTNSIKKYDLIIAGRIMRTKRIEECFEIINQVPSIGRILKVLVVGPVGDIKYYQELIDLSKGLRNATVTFVDGVQQDKLNSYYNESHLMLNTAYAAIDRTVVECMAANTPVFTKNKCVMEMYESLNLLWFYSSRNDEISIKIANYLKKSVVLPEMASLITNHHNVKTLPNRVIDAIK